MMIAGVEPTSWVDLLNHRIGHLSDASPPLHRRRGPGCRLIRVRRGVGDLSSHLSAPFDGFNHRRELVRRASKTVSEPPKIVAGARSRDV